MDHGDDGDVIQSAASVVNARFPATFLPNVISIISGYIRVSSEWTISSACEQDHPRLLRLLLAREVSPRTDPRMVAQMCNRRLDAAAASGRLHIIEDFARYFPTLIITTAAEIAVQAGQPHVASWMMSQDRVAWSDEVLLTAATQGTISGVQRLLRGLRWAPVSPMLYIAIESGHVALAQWSWLDFSARNCLPVLENAIAAAPLPLAQWMADRAPSTVRISIDVAAARGGLDWITWAHARGAIATIRAMDSAAACGRQDVLTWLHDNRDEGCSPCLIGRVAEHDHLSIIQWIFRVKRLSWTSAAVYKPAINGRLDTLQWLLESGPALCPPGTFDQASGHGHLNVVVWMTETGIGQASYRAVDSAAMNGHTEVIEYLHTHRNEGCTTAAMGGAAANGRMEVLTFLHNNRREGCTTDAFDKAPLINDVDVMGFLQALRGEGWTPLALRNAATTASLSTVMWLVERFHIPPTTAVVDAAMASSNLDLVR